MADATQESTVPFNYQVNEEGIMSMTVKFPSTETLSVDYSRQLSDEEFWELCAHNRELVVEKEENGKITFMSPVGFNSGKLESIVTTYLGIWAIEHGVGETASSSTGFILPNGSTRSPDAAWISDERMAEVPEEELEKFPKLVPDFIVEIRSKTDSLEKLKSKMREQWITSGVRLGWLIDPKKEQVFVYRANGSIEVVNGFSGSLSGEDVMKGFEFDLTKLKK